MPGPALPRDGGSCSPSYRPLRPPQGAAQGFKEPGEVAQGRRGDGDSLTVTLGPDKQRHALQALHVADDHVRCPVVPLPVLVEV